MLAASISFGTSNDWKRPVYRKPTAPIYNVRKVKIFDFGSGKSMSLPIKGKFF